MPLLSIFLRFLRAPKTNRDPERVRVHAPMDPFASRNLRGLAGKRGSGHSNQAPALDAKSLRGPNQTNTAGIGLFRQFGIQERPIHGRPQRLCEIGLNIFARVALICLMHEHMRRAEQLRFRPLLMAGHALLEVAGAGEEKRRPATAAGTWAREAIHGRRGVEAFMRPAHAEAVQTT